MPEVKALPCDHKFVDSKHCLKCGWSPEAYLGDGVYAFFDGYSIWLDLRAQDDTTKICLEPDVLDALDRFRKKTLC